MPFLPPNQQRQSTEGLEMRQNCFRLDLYPGPHSGAYSAPLNPLAGGEGAGRPLPRNPNPTLALLASLSRLPNTPPPKINPTYGLEQLCRVQRIFTVQRNSYGIEQLSRRVFGCDKL